MSQLTRNLIRPGIPASLSGPPVLSVVLRAMDPGCHKRNVPDLSRMSTHYHVPLKIHCHTLANITTCHLQYIATQTSLQQLGLHLWNEKTHYHLLHILHCQICYITAQSFFQQMHTYVQLWNSSHLHMPTTLNIGVHVHIFFVVVIFEKNGRDRATFCAGTS